jgi:hypothetical protein
MCIKNQQNALNSANVFLLSYFHLHVLAGLRNDKEVRYQGQNYILPPQEDFHKISLNLKLCTSQASG